MKDLRLTEILNRELKGRNLTQVAREAGISKSLVHDWCKARRSPNARNFPQLLKLAEYLGLTLEELLFGDSVSGDREVLATTSFSDGGAHYKIAIEKINKRGKR